MVYYSLRWKTIVSNRNNNEQSKVNPSVLTFLLYKYCCIFYLVPNICIHLLYILWIDLSLISLLTSERLTPNMLATNSFFWSPALPQKNSQEAALYGVVVQLANHMLQTLHMHPPSLTQQGTRIYMYKVNQHTLHHLQVARCKYHCAKGVTTGAKGARPERLQQYR